MTRVFPLAMPSSVGVGIFVCGAVETAAQQRTAEKNRARTEQSISHLKPLASPAYSHHSGERDAWRCDNPRHSQDLLIFDVVDRGDDQAHIFQEFHLAQSLAAAQLSQGNLAGEFFKRRW